MVGGEEDGGEEEEAEKEKEKEKEEKEEEEWEVRASGCVEGHQDEWV